MATLSLLGTTPLSAAVNTFTIPRPIPAGRHILIACAITAAGSGPPGFSYTDVRGNTYTVDIFIGTGVYGCYAISSHLTTALQVGDVIVTGSGAIIWEATGFPTSGWVEATATDNSTSNTSVSLTVSGTKGRLLVGMLFQDDLSGTNAVSITSAGWSSAYTDTSSYTNAGITHYAAEAVGTREVTSAGTYSIGGGFTPNPGLIRLQFLIAYAPITHISSPWILAPRRGGYHIAYVNSGIKYKTSHIPGKPSFGSEVSVTTDATDTEPRMVDTGRQGRLYIIFTRGSDIYLTQSDGDGESGTWSTPTLLFSGLKHPTIAYDARNGMLWLGAYDATSGKIKVSVIQPIGATPTSAVYAQDDTGADLSGFDDDTFHVAPAYEGGGRWQLIAMKSGSATVWQSVDDGLSFKQVV